LTIVKAVLQYYGKRRLIEKICGGVGKIGWFNNPNLTGGLSGAGLRPVPLLNKPR
jgi:hypothetical protein